MSNLLQIVSQRLKQEPPHQRRFAFCLVLSWLLHILFILPGHGGMPASASPHVLQVKLQEKLSTPISKQDMSKRRVVMPLTPPALAIISASNQPKADVISLPAMPETHSGEEQVASAAELVLPADETVASSPAISKSQDPTLIPWESLASPFYRSSEVDLKAEPLGELTFNYPVERDVANQLGVILIEVLVDENGYVVASHVMESNLPDSYSELAQQRLLQTRYTPAIKGGVPVKNRKLLLLEYDSQYGFH